MCQRVKVENTLPSGLLQPLPVSHQPWTHIFMNFIERLPHSQGCNCLWMVVDMLTKYSHSTPLRYPYTTKIVAELFLKNVFKYHGLPNSIVIHRDTTFTIKFRQDFFTF